MCFNYKIFTCLICFCVAMSACKKKGQIEKENNNLFSAANPIELQRNMTGRLDTPDDVDFFVFTLNDTAVLNISITGMKGINHSLKIWRHGTPPELLKLIDDARKSAPERMKNIVLPAGKYYVSVQHGEGDKKKESEASYTLFIESLNYMGDEEIEPNDSIEQACVITEGRPMKGYFSPACNRLNIQGEEKLREEDWFVLNISCSEDNPKLLDVSISGVPGINSVLQIYDPDKKLVISQDANPAGEGEFVSGLGATKAGAWYIAVFANGRSANIDTSYSLLANITDYDSSLELEPNDTADTATNIANNVISGKMNRAGDVDFFRYTPQQAIGVYRVQVQPDAATDIILAVYSQSNEKLFEINSGGPGEAEIYPNLYSSRSFCCAVSCSGAPTANSSYKLTIEPGAYADGMELEPNDSKEQATIVKGNFISGFTSFPMDKDYFRIKTAGRALIELNINAPKKGKLKVSVTDPMGFILKTKEVSEGGSSTLEETIDGSGYIIAETLKADLDNSYSIQITKK